MRSDTLKRYLKSKNCILCNLSGIYEKKSTNTTHQARKDINLKQGNIANEENKQVNDFKGIDHFISSHLQKIISWKRR